METEFNYNEDYSDLRLYPEKKSSNLVALLLGTVGAIIGAIPGGILWVLLGKIGIIASAAGLVMMAGIIIGFTLLSGIGGGEAHGVAALLVCVIVGVIAVSISSKIVYVGLMVKGLHEAVPMMRNEVVQELESSGMDVSQVEYMLTDEMMESYLCEAFEITEISTSECSRNFSRILDLLEMKGEYAGNLVKCYLFAALGGGAYAAKAFRKR